MSAHHPVTPLAEFGRQAAEIWPHAADCRCCNPPEPTLELAAGQVLAWSAAGFVATLLLIQLFAWLTGGRGVLVMVGAG